MTTPPTPEAVDAAVKYIQKPSDARLYLVATTSKEDRASWSDYDGLSVSARILATEVERLRDVCKRQGIDLMAFTGEIVELRADLEECRRARKGFVQ